MQISITAVTANRKFSKALVRHSGVLVPTKQVALNVDTSKLPFDILQLVFMDEREDYVKAIGRKHDRLFQVFVGIPDERSVDFSDASAFFASMVDRLVSAAKVCRLPPDIESQLIEAIDESLR